MPPDSDHPQPYPRTTDMAEMARRCAPETLGFYRYWDSKRRNPDGSPRRMPRRSDIDPLEMKRWLPFLQLIEVHDHPDGRSLVYRLVGQAEVAVRGYNPTGRTIAECAIGKESSDPMGNYNLVIDGRTPVYDWSRIPHPAGFLVSQECILLPLSDDDASVNMVITFGKIVSTLDQVRNRPPRL
ncbi:MAG: PAS domain-containing protein [Rhodospirillaceae bacterium]|nr:PAS domain-containing protein [Rhodospirillaceae bacterium]